MKTKGSKVMSKSFPHASWTYTHALVSNWGRNLGIWCAYIWRSTKTVVCSPVRFTTQSILNTLRQSSTWTILRTQQTPFCPTKWFHITSFHQYAPIKVNKNMFMYTRVIYGAPHDMKNNLLIYMLFTHTTRPKELHRHVVYPHSVIQHVDISYFFLKTKKQCFVMFILNISVNMC